MTLAANSVARIYRVGSSRNYDAFGCFYRTRRVTRVGGFIEVEPPRRSDRFVFALAGAYVAVDEVTCDPAGCTGGIAIRNLKSGEVRRSGDVADGGGAGGEAHAIVLKANGSAAWTRVFAGTTQVVKLDRTGEAILDADDSLDLNSLALARSTLYWTHAGGPRSAPLE